MNELTVVLKDAEKRISHKFLMYEPYSMQEDDPAILRCIHESMKSFDGEPESIQIKVHMEIQ